MMKVEKSTRKGGRGARIRLRLDDVFIVGKRRPIDPEAVKSLAESMRTIGLQTPITVRVVDHVVEDGHDLGKGFALVAGRHRLEAARLLGWEEIECTEIEVSDLDARLWEISENLHRADLTVQERSDQIAEWVRLTEEKRGEVRQVSGGRGNEGGVAAASRELNMPRTNVRQAVKIASISDEAKEAAKEVGLDKNQSALLKVAAAPRDEQVARVRQLHSAKRKRRDVDDFLAEKRARKAKAGDIEDAINRFIRNITDHTTDYCLVLRAWLDEKHPDLPDDGRGALEHTLHQCANEILLLAQAIREAAPAKVPEPAAPTRAAAIPTTPAANEMPDLPEFLRRTA
jgi:ParB-like chromosome segregation protein Spo0J